MAAYKGTATITRPANTDLYAGNDVVGGAFKLDGFPGGNKNIILTNIKLNIHVTSIPSGMTSYTLKLYRVTPPSALADNAAWDIPAGDRDAYIGSISLGSPADIGSTLTVEAEQINKQFVTGDAGVWAYLVTAGGYTPTSAAVKTIEAYAISAD